MGDMLPFWSTGRIPSGATLKKYGLTLIDWMEMFNRQKGACAICRRPFDQKRINIDHEHVRGWKKMAPEQRRRYIRGLLCYQCNKFMVMRGVTSEKLRFAWQYMLNYEVRLTTPLGSRDFDTGQQIVQGRDVGHPDQDKDKKHHSAKS